jgi:Predicted flavin-nucleotide-binding protein
MYREMRRLDRKMDDAAARFLLENGEYGILSTLGESGFPCPVPMNYVYYNGAVYFHCAGEGQKLDNIRSCPKASFCVVRDAEVVPEVFSTRFESVVLYGNCSEVSGAEKREALIALIQKYSPAFMQKGMACVDSEKESVSVLKLSILEITGKKHD